ncbi:MAG TPA: OsmC family protein [Clostridiaceae bacterium]|nr:OsmC family protein [Clostridiaceae bacterium]
MSEIRAVFESGYRGVVEGQRARLVIGPDENEFGPYDLLLGGLAGCFYVTFLSITEKMQLHYDEVVMDIEGHHREEPPTMLAHVIISMEVKGVDPAKEKMYKRASEIAGKYCSVYQTIGHVAEMETRLTLTP